MRFHKHIVLNANVLILAGSVPIVAGMWMEFLCVVEIRESYQRIAGNDHRETWLCEIKLYSDVVKNSGAAPTVLC